MKLLILQIKKFVVAIAGLMNIYSLLKILLESIV